MRIVFVGRQTHANYCFAYWLAQRHEVCAYFIADTLRYAREHRWRTRWNWLCGRAHRKGWVRAADQLLFQMYFRLFEYKTNNRLLRQALLEHFGAHALERLPSIPYCEFADLNGYEAVTRLTELKPDLVFASCISQYLHKPYIDIPTYGTVLYHEGLTPEYKGLYTAFWAIHNCDDDRIGYTLLRLNEHIDAGQPVAQGIGTIDRRLVRYWAYAGHKALIDGLPEVERALEALARNEPAGIRRIVGPAGMYTYAGLSDQLKCTWRHYWRS